VTVETGDLSVLIVEDEEYWRDIYREVLETYSKAAKIVEATNYGQAKTELDKGSFDIAIIDLSLSGDEQQKQYQGIQLIQELAALLFPPTVIVSTGYKPAAESNPEFPQDFVLGIYEKNTDKLSKLREMFKEARNLRRVQKLLTRASKYISGTTPITKELKKMLGQFVKLTHAYVCHLLLPAEDDKHLEIVVDTGNDEGRQVEIDDSLTGDVFKMRRLINRGDVSKYLRYKPIRDQIQMNSELAVPLLEDSRAIGVLNIERESPEAFTKENEELVRAFASFVVATLQNDRRRQDLQDLVGTTTSQLLEAVVDLDKVFSTTLERGLTLIKASIGLVAMCEGEMLKTVATTHGAESSKGSTLKVADSICGRAVQRGYAINVRDVTTQDDYRPYFKDIPGQGMRSELVVPLRLENKVIGVLNFESPEPSAFTSEDLRLLVALASQAAVAIRISEELKRLAEQTREESRTKTILDLTGGLTHNVNSPANGILFDLSEIQSKYNDILEANPKLKEYLKRIERAAEKVLDVPKLVIEKTRQYKPPMPMTGREFVVSRIQYMRGKNEIPPAVSIVLDETIYDTPMFAVYEDYTPLVIENLVVNAIQAMHGKGKIEIGAQTDSSNQYVEVWVEDSGPGVPSELRDIIFDRFYSTSKQRSGIGLWWVKTHLEQLDATIRVEDATTGKGARFVIRFPTYIEG
jgi:signal transduction histidine kinase/CheY-like chemotaxis protein